MLEDEIAHELRSFTVEDGIILKPPVSSLNASWRRQQKNQPLGAGCLNGPQVGISGHRGQHLWRAEQSKEQGSRATVLCVQKPALSY